MTTAYPLAWPPGWPRTKPSARERWPASRVTLAGSLKECQDELGRLGVRNIILSSNVTLGVERPEDPGVVAYGQWKGHGIAIPCDRWSSVAGNLRAIAKTIEAMRGMERWGARHMIDAMFTGLPALPAPGSRGWREILGIRPDAVVDRELIERRRRELAVLHHPDRENGSAERMAEINAAADVALREMPA
jgi:hypothetical protein